MSQNKGGRPPKSLNEKRAHLVSARFSQAEYDRIQARSSLAKMRVGEFIRSTALNVTIRERLSPEMRRQVSNLASMSNNTNQIARKLNSNAPIDAEEFRRLSRNISSIIDKILR